ncbi:hypothetical protein SAMN05661080_04588 [Modestobacter sp. DSM 44400]|uniref:hypothetical protein n=1 Tax=Modestobacter sp. DSM 44400 TaxID=1550230 RepID=UPI0008992F2A|nr:hypothetical protein [Modestobacter sp. DSM 44400]SDY78043.1 hypothetical protein SAMN05661080_04588 [Modestobacter sp. DSM 44400]
MNRMAVHQSVVHPLDPVDLVELLPSTGWDSIGLHVGAVEEVEQWWSGGAGERHLARLIDLLLETRVSVLDVGRVQLDGPLPRDDVHAFHGRVLDLGARFGAQFVTARFGAPGWPAGRSLAERVDVFGQLAEQARPFRLRPLLAPVPVTRPDLVADAVSVVAPSRGGLVLDVQVSDTSPAEVEAAVDSVLEHLGYIRLSARQVAASGELAAGLLATLPPHVPVAIGGDDSLGLVVADHRPRLVALHEVVDRMLEHPRARARRLSAT